MNDGLVEEVVPINSEIVVCETSLNTMNCDELVEEITVDSKSMPPTQYTDYTPGYFHIQFLILYILSVITILKYFRKQKVYIGDFESPDDIESPNSRLKY